MTSIQLKCLKQYVTQHGKVVSYVRRKGYPNVRIKGIPGSAEFMAAYHAALAGEGIEEGKKQYRSAAKGSFGALCLAYYASSTFKQLDKATQYWRRRELDKICENHRNGIVAELTPKHIRKLRDQVADRPSMSKKRLKALKALFKWATEEGLTDDDPTKGVMPISYITKGFHTWTEEEIAQFEQHQ
jgi:integrase/recombinase XerD